MTTRSKTIQALAYATIVGTIWQLWTIAPGTYDPVLEYISRREYAPYAFCSFASSIMAGTIAIRTLLKRRKLSALCYTTIAMIVINLCFHWRWILYSLSVAPDWNHLQIALGYVIPLVLVAFRLSVSSGTCKESNKQIQHQMNGEVIENEGCQAGRPQQKSLVRCPKCEAMISASAKFCPECGVSTKAKCAKCGTRIPPDVKFCPECGETQR